MAVCIAAGPVLSGCPVQSGSPVAGETRTFDGIEFQWCPPGTFVMGTNIYETGRHGDEWPRAVTLTKGFWLSKYEITQAQWEEVMGANPSQFVGANNPVEYITWEDVRQFLVYLNYTKSTVTYRLPTEAEWEYACRAGTYTRYYWGDDPGDVEANNYAWHGLNSSGQHHPVGEKLPNDWGLYDMSGNVWEWCQDWYDADFYLSDSLEPVTDPQGPETGTQRVIRGGDWGQVVTQCRSGNRNYEGPNTIHPALGFRLLREAD
ncbi:MAG: formylglycine-generating enzyme family protein [Candidatus Hydrogenedentes bacterium]|nr:formylglycine-generating enzyme family protein [Candidatus Hydrogenedentota bacterium]